MFVHPCKFSIGEFPRREEFDQSDCEMGHEIYCSEVFGLWTAIRTSLSADESGFVRILSPVPRQLRRQPEASSRE